MEDTNLVNELAEEQAKRRKERETEDLKVLLKMPEGRRLFWRYMGDAGVFRSSYTGDQGTNFNEGQRNIGLKMFNDVLNTDIRAFAQMQQEHVALVAAEQLALDKVKNGGQ